MLFRVSVISSRLIGDPPMRRDVRFKMLDKNCPDSRSESGQFYTNERPLSLLLFLHQPFRAFF